MDQIYKTVEDWDVNLRIISVELEAVFYVHIGL